MKIIATILAMFSFGTPIFAQNPAQDHAEKYYESIKNNPEKLFFFLHDMPKGGDLHNHEAGATYAENLLRYAQSDNLCVDKKTFAASIANHCETALNTAIQDPTFYNALIDAWSMRNFHSKQESGHDHFFATFGKFGAATKNHSGEMLAEISERAALQNESYLELMVTADGNESGQLGKKLGWNPDLAQMRANLLAADFGKIVADISNNLDHDEQVRNQLLSCNKLQSKAGCHIKVRYLYQVLREQAPEMVFAQLLAGFEAASKDPRIVGINIVQPEDGIISMRDYKLHMQMIGFLHQLYPNVHISLHAGELTDALVPHDGLTFHIHDAVEVAHANRIGHGVDIAQENNADQLMKEMADQHIMVEINLTSNAQILNVEGKTHPLPLYLQNGVPVALSTDDEGVSRGNLTNEYLRAAKTYQFNYSQLKTFARNSITYAFLPGKSLWQDQQYQQIVPECQKDNADANPLTASCQAFLDNNEKARMQWDLEKRFKKFEEKF